MLDRVKKYKIYYIISIIVVIIALLGFTYAYFENNVIDNTGFNPVLAFEETYKFEANNDKGPVSAEIKPLDMYYDGTTSAVFEDSQNITIKLTNNSNVTTTCSYDVVWEWDSSSDGYVISPGAEKEFTISENAWGEKQLANYNVASQIIYSSSITAEGIGPQTEVLNVNVKFYNLADVDQSFHADKHYSGAIKVKNVRCDDSSQAFAIFSEDDGSLTFYNNSDIIENGIYKGKTVTEKYVGFEDTLYNMENEKFPEWIGVAEKVISVSFEDEISPVSTVGWFAYMENCISFDLENLDTSKVTDMSFMFAEAGANTTDFQIKGIETLDTTKVMSMQGMFSYAGQNAPNWRLGDLSTKAVEVEGDGTLTKNAYGFYFDKKYSGQVNIDGVTTNVEFTFYDDGGGLAGMSAMGMTEVEQFPAESLKYEYLKVLTFDGEDWYVMGTFSEDGTKFYITGPDGNPVALTLEAGTAADQKNVYGFYFNRAYTGQINDDGTMLNVSLTFLENETVSIVMSVDGQPLNLTIPAIYEHLKVFLHDEEFDEYYEGGTFSSDGTQFYMNNGDETAVLTLSDNSNNSGSLQKNSYGFYFNQAYTGQLNNDGIVFNVSMSFYEDGNVLMTQSMEGMTESYILPTTEVRYEYLKLYAYDPETEEMHLFGEFSPDGNQLLFNVENGIALTLTLDNSSSGPVKNEYGFYFNQLYSGQFIVEGMSGKFSIVFNENGSGDLIVTINGETLHEEFYEEQLLYHYLTVSIYDDGDGTYEEIGTFSADGTQFYTTFYDADVVLTLVTNSNTSTNEKNIYGFYFNRAYTFQSGNEYSMSITFYANGSALQTTSAYGETEATSMPPGLFTYSYLSLLSGEFVVANFSSDGTQLYMSSDVEGEEIILTLSNDSSAPVKNQHGFYFNQVYAGQMLIEGTMVNFSAVFLEDGTGSATLLYDGSPMTEHFYELLYDHLEIQMFDGEDWFVLGTFSEDGTQLHMSGVEGTLYLSYNSSIPAKNQYGFYFDTMYNSSDGYNSFIFDSAGGVRGYVGGKLVFYQILPPEMFESLSQVFSEDGMYFEMEGVIYTAQFGLLPAYNMIKNEYGFYFHELYVYEDGTGNYGIFIFEEDDTALVIENSNAQSIPVTYSHLGVSFEYPVSFNGTFSPDGKTLSSDIDGDTINFTLKPLPINNQNNNNSTNNAGPQKNEYGFYFGQKYNISMLLFDEAITGYFMVNADGSGVINIMGEETFIPPGTLTYSMNTVSMSGQEIAQIAGNGAFVSVITGELDPRLLGRLEAPAGYLGSEGVYYNVSYTTTFDGMQMSAVFFEDGLALIYENGLLVEGMEPGSVSYSQGNIYYEGMIIGTTSANGTILEMQGQTLYANTSEVATQESSQGSGVYRLAWDTSNVTDMSYMFADAGMHATKWNIGNIANWNTMNVTNMSHMFANAGMYAAKWELTDLSPRAVLLENGKITQSSTEGLTKNEYGFYFGQTYSGVTSMLAPISIIFYENGSANLTWNNGTIDVDLEYEDRHIYDDIMQGDFSTYISPDGTIAVDSLWGVVALDTSSNNSIYQYTSWITHSLEDSSRMFANAGAYAQNFSLNLAGWDLWEANKDGIFDGMNSLKEITLSYRTDLFSYLPIPSPEYIPGATGYWYNSKGEGYTQNNRPNLAGENDVFTAVP